MKQVLMIMAHPDDEVLWGWPILQMPDVMVNLLVISNNRQTYGHRAEAALRSVCDVEKIFLVECVGYESNFYRKPTRDLKNCTLTDMALVVNRAISRAIKTVKPDIIFTHNPIGEYGHGDHRLLFELVCSHPMVNEVWYTDICLKNKSHVSYKEIPRHIAHAFYLGPTASMEIFPDLKRLEPIKYIYQIRHKAWSWNNPTAEKCVLYKIEC